MRVPEESNAQDKAKDDKAKDGSDNQVALEMMKFIAVTTGFGKGQSVAGFGKERQIRTPEEHADALIDLFERCRAVVSKTA
ncbi:MAG: hypothetical protein SFV18_22275 [Bryobacteraceae bacterium]|nr:hypothetical protein [Bryobacteraceae bacterium]